MGSAKQATEPGKSFSSKFKAAIESQIWLWIPALVAFGIGCAVITVDKGNSQGFGDLPEFYAWATIIGGQTGIWVLVAAQGWMLLKELPSRYPPTFSFTWLPRFSYGLLGLALFFLGLLLQVPREGSPLPGHHIRLLFLSLLGFLAAGPSLIGIWRVQLVLDGDVAERTAQVRRPLTWSAVERDLLERLILLRSLLQKFLGGLGTILAALTFATGALRNAVVAWKTSAPPPPHAALFDVPLIYVVTYGLFFTLVVALIYLPVYGSIERAGQDFVDAVCPVPTDNAPSAEWQALRDRLSKQLQLGIRAEDSLKSGVSILAPLLATLLPILLPGAK